MKYTTKRDALDQVIILAIEASGVAKAEEYDLDAIFDAVFEYSEEDQAYIQTGSDEEFWAAVEKAEKQ